VRYVLDPQTSRFTVRASAGGPLAAMGHSPVLAIRDFSGEVEFDPASPAESCLRLVAAAGSLALTGEASEGDRRDIERTTRDEVLESARFPEISYVCRPPGVTAIGPMQLMLQGDLTLHGVTRRQPVSARIYLVGGLLRGQGEAAVKQSEYGIRPVSVAGGMLKVKDEVALSFEIVARLAPDVAAADAGGESGGAIDPDRRSSGPRPCAT
jgi:polyisoprenoid-binding protein YceI